MFSIIGVNFYFMLEGKNIVIIGGTTGLGFSAAKAFVKNGANVVVVGRNPENCISAELSLGESARALKGDASDSTTAVKAIEISISERKINSITEERNSLHLR